MAKKKVKKSSSKKKTHPKSVSSAKPSNKTREVNWVLVLVMSVILGMLGVDRFIMGRIGTGLLKLFITVISFGLLGWIWWIVDIVLIATKYEFKGITWVD